MTKKESRTLAELQECEALKNAIETLNANLPKESRFTQARIAEHVGIMQGSVSAFLNGTNALSLEFALKVSGITGISLASFSQRMNDLVAGAQHIDDGQFLAHKGYVDQVPCPVFFSRLSERPPYAFSVHKSEETHSFLRRDLKAISVDEALVACTVISDSSMEPNIKAGSIVAFDGVKDSLCDLLDGQMYVFEIHGQIKIRRAFRAAEFLVLRAFNREDFDDDHLPYDETVTDLKIMGRVFWFSTFLS